MRAYIRLDPGFAERKATYPDGPYRALVDTLCLAESQPQRGRFRSERVLRALLDKAGKHVAYLIAHHDLDVLPDGRLYVVGWDEWQEGDVTVAERVRRIRGRRQGNGQRNGPGHDHLTTGTVTSDTAGRYRGNTLKTDSGGYGVAEASSRDSGLPAALSDEEQREHLDKLRESIEAKGILPSAKDRPKPNGGPKETDEDVIARCRAILDDSEAPDWKRESAKTQLGLMGVR